MNGFLSRNRLAGLVIAAVIFIVDQWVKWLVAGPLGLLQEGDHLDLFEYFDFTRTHNFGVSLGMFTATSLEMRWALVGLTSLIALGVLVWMFRERRFLDILPLALVLGGALGNIRDRATFGYVLDYADLHIGEWRPFLIFNIADAAITIGVAIILVRALFVREKPVETAETTSPDVAET